MISCNILGSGHIKSTMLPGITKQAFVIFMPLFRGSKMTED